MNVIQAFVPADIVKTFATFLNFYYIARRDVITEDSLKQLSVALKKFHEARQVFSGTVRAVGPSAFSLPRQHAMVHYYDHIKNFGAPNGLCSSITESKHITAVKCPWRRSNKHAALSQMLKSNERLDKLGAARVDFTTRGMLADSCLIQAIKDALTDHDNEDPMDEDANNSDESDSDTSSTLSTFGAGHADTRNIGTTISTNDAEIDTPDDTDTPADIDDDTDIPADIDDDRPPSPTLLDDDEEDDCGPVESGPLMNEVRLVSKKGKEPLHGCCTYSNITRSAHAKISHITCCPRSKDWPTQSR